MATYAVQFITKEGAFCGQTITNRPRAILLVQDGLWVNIACVIITIAANSQMERLKMDDTEIASLQPLPYPGEPRLGYKSGDCPSFCMHPAKCAGRHSCPRSISCVD